MLLYDRSTLIKVIMEYDLVLFFTKRDGSLLLFTIDIVSWLILVSIHRVTQQAAQAVYTRD